MKKLASLLQEANEDYYGFDGNGLDKIAEDLYWQGRIIGSGIVDELTKSAGIRSRIRKGTNAMSKKLFRRRAKSKIRKGTDAISEKLFGGNRKRKWKKRTLQGLAGGAAMAGSGYLGYEIGRRNPYDDE